MLACLLLLVVGGGGGGGDGGGGVVVSATHAAGTPSSLGATPRSTSRGLR